MNWVATASHLNAWHYLVIVQEFVGIKHRLFHILYSRYKGKSKSQEFQDIDESTDVALGDVILHHKKEKE